MSLPLSDSDLDHLLNFIGYGRLEADVWFLGMEEAGGGEANIRARLKFRPVEDNAEEHKMLGVTHLHWGRRKIHGQARSPLVGPVGRKTAVHRTGQPVGKRVY